MTTDELIAQAEGLAEGWNRILPHTAACLTNLVAALKTAQAENRRLQAWNDNQAHLLELELAGNRYDGR